jgi:hypothetical protein
MPKLSDIASIRETPRNASLGAISDFLNYVDKNALQQQFGYKNPVTGGISEILGIPAAARVANKLSYGEPISNIGKANVAMIPDDTAQAAMMAGPLIGKYGRVAGRMGAKAINDAMFGEGALAKITPQPMFLDVYHGSRHPFTKCDKSKIGTGEGNQSYGHGFYVAEHPQVAKEYTTAGMSLDPAKTKYKGRNIETWYNEAQRKQDMAYRNKASNEKISEINAELGFWESLMTRRHPQTLIDEYMHPEYGGPEYNKFAQSIDMNKFKGIVEQPNFYKVDLPDQQIAKMLDYDAPLGSQGAKVKELASKYGLSDTDLGGDLLLKVGKGSGGSEIMKQHGLTGVKYFDQMSRDAQQGTRNFVVFDPEHLKILEHNQKPVP